MKVSVELDVYEWHKVLDVFEEEMCIVNRNPEMAIMLYEKIATQLNGVPVKVARPEKKETIIAEEKLEEKKGILKKWFNW